jgi:hypothetical protein
MINMKKLFRLPLLVLTTLFTLSSCGLDTAPDDLYPNMEKAMNSLVPGGIIPALRIEKYEVKKAYTFEIVFDIQLASRITYTVKQFYAFAIETSKIGPIYGFANITTIEDNPNFEEVAGISTAEYATEYAKTEFNNEVKDLIKHVEKGNIGQTWLDDLSAGLKATLLSTIKDITTRNYYRLDNKRVDEYLHYLVLHGVPQPITEEDEPLAFDLTRKVYDYE